MLTMYLHKQTNTRIFVQRAATSAAISCASQDIHLACKTKVMTIGIG